MTLGRLVRRTVSAVLGLGALTVGGFVLLVALTPDPRSSPRPHSTLRRPERSTVGAPHPRPGRCGPPDAEAADEPGGVSPFGRPERGWAVYAPLIAREIGADCGPRTPVFAAALGRWQAAQRLTPHGRVDGPTLSRLATIWLLRRPFLRAMRRGCPPSPDEASLVQAARSEGWAGKAVRARPAALDAYRRMAASARAQLGATESMLTLVSGYRGPAEEASRCADGSCGGPAKARCSAHRTGLAFDLFLGVARPGADPTSTADADRLYQSRTPAYRWLVANADRFGFVPYPFEPWHWEWTGEDPRNGMKPPSPAPVGASRSVGLFRPA